MDGELRQFILAHASEGRIKCPLCSEERKKSHLKTMSLTAEEDRVVYHCHHCGASGAIRRSEMVRFIDHSRTSLPKPKQTHTVVEVPVSQGQKAMDDFLLSRGINFETASKFGLVSSEKWFAGHGKSPAIGFVYSRKTNDQAEAIKWRAIDEKLFTQQGAARSFYGLDQLPPGTEDLVICEGEMDVLALAEAGIAAVSVPNGAPQRVKESGEIDPESDGKFSFVWHSHELIESVKRVIFFPDQDEPGESLVEELARRIGRARCWVATVPEGCKDANDALLKHGAQALQEALQGAKPMPLEGLYLPEDFSSQIVSLYDGGAVRGASTGLETLDNLYTVLPGQLSVVTGLPGSGKSELIDQIVVNIARTQGWRFAICSFENPPSMHLAKLAEKIVGKPFFGQNRMSVEERDSALSWLNHHFVFLQSHDGAPSTVQSIIDRTKQAIMRMGIRGLVIDPYNYLSMGGDSEHQAISRMLSDIALFCRSHSLHVWFVAHPAKMAQDVRIPTGQHISGSAAWFAKADMGLTVHRVKNQPITEVHVWKSRFKWVGKLGDIRLAYDLPTGVYSDLNVFPEESEFGEFD